MFYPKIKRTFDFVVAILLLFALAPLMVLIAVAIRKSMGGAVLFSQARPGLNGKIFNMYKFRTMVPLALTRLQTDVERITKLGRWLRATSLDELPELVNVIKGEMSLVGPRPLLVEYLEKYTPTQMRRHEVLPGITGLAQVRGRNDLSWKNKFKYDVFYVDHVSLMLDFKILWETVGIVLFRKGFRLQGEPTKFGENI